MGSIRIEVSTKKQPRGKVLATAQWVVERRGARDRYKQGPPRPELIPTASTSSDHPEMPELELHRIERQVATEVIWSTNRFAIGNAVASIALTMGLGESLTTPRGMPHELIEPKRPFADRM